MSFATVTLIVEIVFYLVLCAGVVAQVKKHYHWHDRLQAPVVVLNLLFIIFVMIPTFRIVATDLPGGLSNVPTLVTTIHAALGTTAQLVSIYLLLAGFKILPRKIGVLRYWMWAGFVLWTLTILFGIGVYILFYTGDTSAEEAVTEHDPDLVEEAVTDETISDAPPEEIVEEHAAEEIIEEEPAEFVEEGVEEHAAEEIVIEETAEPTPEPSPTPTPVPTPVQVGTLVIADNQNHGDQLTIEMNSVDMPAEGTVYEIWLGKPEESPVSLGLLPVENGAVNFTFIDPEGRNLLGLYSDMFISEEPAGDTDPTPSETMAFTGSVSPDIIDPVRLAVVADPDTPDGDGPIFNARAEVVNIELETGFQQEYSIAENDLNALKIQAEGVVNILEGTNGPNFGDNDGSGDVYNTGDGFGLLSYLERTLTQIEAVSQAERATPEVLARAEQAGIAVKSALGQAERLRDIELQILAIGSTAEAADLVTEANDIVRVLLDIGEAGFSDPAQAGTVAAYTFVQQIGTIDIFALPKPEAPTEELIEETEESVDEHAEEVPDLISEPADDQVSEHDGN